MFARILHDRINDHVGGIGRWRGSNYRLHPSPPPRRVPKVRGNTCDDDADQSLASAWAGTFAQDRRDMPMSTPGRFGCNGLPMGNERLGSPWLSRRLRGLTTSMAHMARRGIELLLAGQTPYVVDLGDPRRL